MSRENGAGRELDLVLARKQPFRSSWSSLARLKDGRRFWALIASPQVVARIPPAGRAAFDRVEILPDGRDEAWWESAVSLSREATVARIATHDEYCVELAGTLRDHLGLAGPGGRACRAYTDKVEMKARAAANGIGVPRFSSSSASTGRLQGLVEQFLARVGGPVVVKPVRGANSRDTAVVVDRAAARSIDWASWTRGPYQVEQFVAGDIFFSDVLVDGAGGIAPLMFGEYLNPPLGFASGRPHGSISIPFDDAVARALWEQHLRILRVLPEVRGSVTECEFIRERSSGEWVLMECAARAPGAYIARTGEVVVGQNLEEIHLAAQLELAAPDPSPSGRHAAWVWYPRRPGTVCALREPALTTPAELSWTVAPGDRVADRPMDGNSELNAALTVFVSGAYASVRADFESLRGFEPLVMCEGAARARMAMSGRRS